AVIDQVDQYTQTTENRRVFTADHAGSVDDQATGRVAQGQDGVAVIDARMREVDIGRAIRTRTRGDDELGRYQALNHAVGADHFDRLRIGEAGHTKKDVDAVASVIAGA